MDAATSPHAWTAELVREHLRYTGKVTGAHYVARRLADRYLGSGPERTALLRWVTCTASGSSLAGLCREVGASRATLYRHRDVALRQIAEGLSHDRVPLA
jgi:hypothetical protein